MAKPTIRDLETILDEADGAVVIAPDGSVFVTPNVIKEIAAERERQVRVEGWTQEHDDQHVGGEMAKAASCYALCAGVGVASGIGVEDHYSFREDYASAGCPSPPWPWSREWWKPKDPRRDLVRAAALIVAEIERLDRAQRNSPSGADGRGHNEGEGK